jgi:ABC-type phosphate/phosphonate transport system substrate-binding protein
MSRLIPRLCLWLSLAALSPTLFAKPLIFAAPPRESAAAGEKLYGPLAAELGKLVGEKVVYEHPANWPRYAEEMRQGRYSFVFDGPHFAAWRMVHLHQVPLVRLPGTLRFVVVVPTQSKIENLQALKFSRVCAIPSPNLTSVMLLARFGPVASPTIWPSMGGNGKTYQRLKAGKCDAAVLRDQFFSKKLSAEQRKGLRVVFTSDPYPNQTLTVSSQLSVEVRQRIINALTSGDGAEAVAPILKRFGDPGATTMVAASAVAYRGDNKLLEGHLWGW